MYVYAEGVSLFLMLFVEDDSAHSLNEGLWWSVVMRMVVLFMPTRCFLIRPWLVLCDGFPIPQPPPSPCRPSPMPYQS